MRRYLANGGTFRYNDDEERLAASSSDFVAWAARAGPQAAAEEGTTFHFVCECFFMTAATLHMGAAQVIESMQTSQREYEHLLQQGPLARQDIVRPSASTVAACGRMCVSHGVKPTVAQGFCTILSKPCLWLTGTVTGLCIHTAIIGAA